jgi:hypothetical protein
MEKMVKTKNIPPGETTTGKLSTLSIVKIRHRNDQKTYNGAFLPDCTSQKENTKYFPLGETTLGKIAFFFSISKIRHRVSKKLIQWHTIEKR